MTDQKIAGLTLKLRIARCVLHGVDDRQGIAADLFATLGRHGISIDALTTTPQNRRRADIALAVMEEDVPRLARITKSLKQRYGARAVSIEKDRALIALYGAHHLSIGGVAGQVCSRFSALGINIEMISSTLSALTIVIKKDRAPEIAEILKKEFT